MRVVATAGHVDHGKSTLVRAMTGTDPDRLAEEKARGLTIELGFASMMLPSGAAVAFVDVPGHVRFLKNMIAGVGAVDACLFVVAATEGWKPQSEEHLRILALLGISHGIIVVTKADLIDDGDREVVELTIRERVEGTFLERSPLVWSDGVNVDGVIAAVDGLVRSTPQATDWGRARLWVDRSFPVRGAGTVVTGTLAGGVLRTGDTVVVAPGGFSARIRQLHSHNVGLPVADPGRRLAVNLAGLAHQDVRRGQAIVQPGLWHEATVVDASLSVIASLSHPVGRRGAYLAYIGSGEFPVSLRILGPLPLEPGEAGLIRLRLPVPLPLQPGDRFILREAGRAETVGGGEVLDVAPVLPASRAAPSKSVARVVAERGWVDAELLGRLTGEPATPTVGRWVVDPAVLEETRERLTKAASDGAAIDVATLSERERAVVAAGLPGLNVLGGRLSASPSAGLSAEASSVLDTLAAGRASPPSMADALRPLRELERQGLAVETDGLWFAASAVSDAAAVIAELLAASPDGITVAQVRDALGTSRKHAVPLLAHLDATGVTRRRGDLRIGGPRLPASSAASPSAASAAAPSDPSEPSEPRSP